MSFEVWYCIPFGYIRRAHGGNFEMIKYRGGEGAAAARWCGSPGCRSEVVITNSDLSAWLTLLLHLRYSI